MFAAAKKNVSLKFKAFLPKCYTFLDKYSIIKRVLILGIGKAFINARNESIFYV